jgi:hypothetical protein
MLRLLPLLLRLLPLVPWSSRLPIKQVQPCLATQPRVKPFSVSAKLATS